jgi:hypothetical protein
MILNLINFGHVVRVIQTKKRNNINGESNLDIKFEQSDLEGSVSEEQTIKEFGPLMELMEKCSNML